MITVNYNAAVGALEHSDGKGHCLLAAAIAANLTRISRVNSLKRPASILSFAFRYQEKVSPGHVDDRLE
jgi:hypothetical protein